MVKSPKSVRRATVVAGAFAGLKPAYCRIALFDVRKDGTKWLVDFAGEDACRVVSPTTSEAQAKRNGHFNTAAGEYKRFAIMQCPDEGSARTYAQQLITAYNVNVSNADPISIKLQDGCFNDELARGAFALVSSAIKTGRWTEKRKGEWLQKQIDDKSRQAMNDAKFVERAKKDPRVIASLSEADLLSRLKLIQQGKEKKTANRK